MPYSYSGEQELSSDVWNPPPSPNNAHIKKYHRLTQQCTHMTHPHSFMSFRNNALGVLDIIQETRRASMVLLVNIGTLRILGVFLSKSGTPPANRLDGNLKIVSSTVQRDTFFLYSPINKENNVTPLG